ncbi:MAG: hypothetical protein J6C00_11110 [Eubacterium sp.]|nr:hypothetical protein [Eubacterium sp.]
MRITNGMMMNTTKLNINSNKVSVDRLNTQMSTQKKITKPSDNPLIAIKSLRLSTTLSQINQYCNNNIKDAQSWMDVTETALTNMKDIFKDAYRLCVNGSTDTLTDEDRYTILTQLKALSGQLYSEANADYANRTVFSGYKTNSTVTFNDSFEASQAKYEIFEQLSASDIEAYTYYANKLDTPVASEIENQTAVATPEEVVLKRLRLSYNKQTNLNSLSYNYSVDTSSSQANGTTTGNVTIKTSIDAAANATNQTFQWRSLRKDSAFTYEADENGKMSGASLEDMNGYVLNISTDGKFTVDDPSLTLTTRKTTINGATTTHFTYTDTSGNMVFTAQETENGGVKTAFAVDAQGNKVSLTYTGGTITEVTDPQGNTINTNLTSTADENNITVKNADGNTAMTASAKYVDAADPSKGMACTVHTEDKDLTTDLKVETMTQQEFEKHLAKLAADNPAGISDTYKDTIIYLPDSGELVFGTNIAQNMSSEFATLNVDYEKDGFEKGETRPEMYFNCVDKTDASAINHITYTNYDKDNNWIYQNIDYAVSANQDMTINTQIHDVASADCYRDLAELTDIVQASIDAHTTVSNIEQMIKSVDYTGEDEQKYLQDCLEKAKKQMAYTDDHLQKVFGSQISHFEKYMNKVNLAITDIGSRGDQLSLAENRISSQKTTFTQLKSNNEDEELSDVTIDYTSAYTAYQASLQAAGKIDDMSLLDYL